MFDEIRFNKIDRLPNYVFAEVNELKMAERRTGADVIDFSMGIQMDQHLNQPLIN